MNRRRLAIMSGVLAVAVAIGAAIAWRGDLMGIHPTVRGAEPVTVPSSAVRIIARGLSVPWGLAFLPDGTALVTERGTARLLSVRPDGTVTEIQRIDAVVPAGEGGLLGIAVAPTYSSDGWVYLYYTTATDNRIGRLRLGQPPQPILTGLPKAGNHNGGRIAFGPDGMLYVGTGDAGDRDRAQQRDYLGGKVLRLTPDGKPAPGNPFGASPVYSLGHRNVQGLAWDAAGQLYAAEFGQNRYDELNRIVPGGNYGWPLVEGIGGDPAYLNPVATWATSDASPSGIAIRHNVVYLACLRGTKLYQVNLDGTNAHVLLPNEYGRLRTVAVAPDGALWVMTSNKDGRGSPSASDDRILRLDLAA